MTKVEKIVRRDVVGVRAEDMIVAARRLMVDQAQQRSGRARERRPDRYRD